MDGFVESASREGGAERLWQPSPQAARYMGRPGQGFGRSGGRARGDDGGGRGGSSILSDLMQDISGTGRYSDDDGGDVGFSGVSNGRRGNAGRGPDEYEYDDSELQHDWPHRGVVAAPNKSLRVAPLSEVDGYLLSRSADGADAADEASHAGTHAQTHRHSTAARGGEGALSRHHTHHHHHHPYHQQQPGSSSALSGAQGRYQREDDAALTELERLLIEE